MRTDPPASNELERARDDVARVALVADRRALLAVLCVWLGLLVAASVHLARVTRPIPMVDDLEYAALVAGIEHPSLELAWAQANEHRLPLPRAILFGLLALGAELRAGSYAQLALRALLALGLVVLARRLRGSTSVLDAFFPLLLVHIGDPESLLVGMAIATPIAPLVVGAFLACTLRSRAPPSLGSALLLALVLVAAPLNGGFGLALWPPLCAWAAFAGVHALRAARRASALALLGGALASLAVVALYFTGFEREASATLTLAPLTVLRTAWSFQALQLGSAGQFEPFLGATIASVLALPALVWTLGAWRRERAERVRASALLAAVFAAWCLALAVGVGRSGHGGAAGLANRYIVLAASGAIPTFLAYELYGPRRIARALQAALCVVQLGVQPFHFAYGSAEGERRARVLDELQAAVRAGESVDVLAQRFTPAVYPDAQALAHRLRMLRIGGVPPFTRADASNALAPTHVRAPLGSRERVAFDRQVLAVASDAELEYALPSSARRVVGGFGMLANTWRVAEGRSAGMRFQVLVRGRAGVERVLFERELDPARRASDRGWLALDLELPAELADGSSVLLLRTASLEHASAARDWGFWSSIELR